MIHPSYRVELTDEVQGEAGERTYPPGTGGVVVDADWDADVYTVAVPVEEGAADDGDPEYVRLPSERFRVVPGVDMGPLADYRWLGFHDAVRGGDARAVAEAAEAYVTARGRGPKPRELLEPVRRAAEELAEGGDEERTLACKVLYRVARSIPDPREGWVEKAYQQAMSIAAGIAGKEEAALRRAQALLGLAELDRRRGREEQSVKRLEEVVDLLGDQAVDDPHSEAARLHGEAIKRLAGPDPIVY